MDNVPKIANCNVHRLTAESYMHSQGRTFIKNGLVIMDLPYNWDFIQNNISPEKLAELRRRFMEEWRSGNYTKKEMIERYRMSERTFRDTKKRYSETRELDDYKDESRSSKNPHRKFTEEEYQEVLRTFDRTRENANSRFLDFIEDMHADKRNLSPPKLKAQKRKIWDVRPGVRKIKAILDESWAEKEKTISKSYVHDLLKKFEKYPEEVNKEQKKNLQDHCSQENASA